MAASAVSGRCVYAGVVEHSVYVHPGARGFPENTASLALHRGTGFRVAGIRERIGQHRGRWRDVALIERRSPIV